MKKLSLEAPRQEREVIDFPSIFKERLEAIAPLSSEEECYFQYDFREVGINTVKREGIVLTILHKTDSDLEYDLWLEDPKSIVDQEFPHDEARERLSRFANQPDYNQKTTSAFIVQDDKDKLYLLLGEKRAPYVRKGVQWEKHDRNLLVSLMKKYGIEKILGVFPEMQNGEGKRTIESILDFDLLGIIRENNAMHEFAEKLKMTNNQYLRFRAIVRSYHDAQRKERGVSLPPKSWEEIAKEVMGQDKGDVGWNP